jgi:hypothetical protein
MRTPSRSRLRGADVPQGSRRRRGSGYSHDAPRRHGGGEAARGRRAKRRRSRCAESRRGRRSMQYREREPLDRGDDEVERRIRRAGRGRPSTSARLRIPGRRQRRGCGIDRLRGVGRGIGRLRSCLVDGRRSCLGGFDISDRVGPEVEGWGGHGRRRIGEDRLRRRLGRNDGGSSRSRIRYRGSRRRGRRFGGRRRGLRSRIRGSRIRSAFGSHGRVGRRGAGVGCGARGRRRRLGRRCRRNRRLRSGCGGHRHRRRRKRRRRRQRGRQRRQQARRQQCQRIDVALRLGRHTDAQIDGRVRRVG